MIKEIIWHFRQIGLMKTELLLIINGAKSLLFHFTKSNLFHPRNIAHLCPSHFHSPLKYSFMPSSLSDLMTAWAFSLDLQNYEPPRAWLLHHSHPVIQLSSYPVIATYWWLAFSSANKQHLKKQFFFSFSCTVKILWCGAERVFAKATVVIQKRHKASSGKGWRPCCQGLARPFPT